MRTIGIRARPDVVTFAVMNADKSFSTVERIHMPKSFEPPEALKHLRSILLDVLSEYKIQAAGVRVTEPLSKSLNVERIQIEGVIQEAFASSDLLGYYVGQISSISARLGVDRTQFKRMVDDGVNVLDIAGWASMSKEAREAVLCALGAQHVAS
jgi:hypothetical protein